MQLKDDPTIAGIRETRHHISEEFGHDPQRIVEYYIELQKKEEEQRRQLKQAESEQLLEAVGAA
jgi:hypothetical protein